MQRLRDITSRWESRYENGTAYKRISDSSKRKRKRESGQRCLEQQTNLIQTITLQETPDKRRSRTIFECIRCRKRSEVLIVEEGSNERMLGRSEKICMV